MGKQKQKNYTAEFKAKVALEAIRGDLTMNEISSKYQVHTTQIQRWKQQALGNIKDGFTNKHGAPRKRHSASSWKCCRESVDPTHFVPSLEPIGQQCNRLSVGEGNYRP